MPRLSIIIPAYQEAKRIEKTLDQLAVYLTTHRYTDTEVVVVNADSPDGTAALAQSKAKLFEQFCLVPAGPRAGKGRDVRLGMLSARGQYRLYMDADLATPLHHLETMREFMSKKVDIVIAVRNLESTHKGFRKLISEGGNWLVQALLLRGIVDSQCGFKMFSAEATEKIFRRQTILGWGFDMEILAIARRLGYRIHIIPITDWSDKPGGTFEGQVGTAAIQTLGDLLAIWWRRLGGRYRYPTFDIEESKR